MMRTPFIAAAVAMAALAFAAPAAAKPCDAGAGMDSVEYALGILDAAPPKAQDPPEPPSPTPYEPDCDIMDSECDSGCDAETETVDGWGECYNACMDRAGC